MTPDLRASWYDHPRLYDLAFASETPAEAAFIDAACRRHCRFAVRRLLEPACGSGRLVAALAARGYRVTGFDLSRPALEYARRRMARRGLRARLFRADMAEFRLPRPVDAAYSTFDSFRHLLTEDAARQHLDAVAASVRPGGIYILGFHLLPPDASQDCTERWTERRARSQVTVTLRVIGSDRRRRRETIRVSLLARSGVQALRLRDEFPLRLYTARQFRALLAAVPQWELAATHDFWYELDRPLELSDELADAVLILRRRGSRERRSASGG